MAIDSTTSHVCKRRGFWGSLYRGRYRIFQRGGGLKCMIKFCMYITIMKVKQMRVSELLHTHPPRISLCKLFDNMITVTEDITVSV